MTIQIDGTNNLNKGAELMLYAVLQEIERRHPEATVYWNDDSFLGDIKSISTSINLKKTQAHLVALFLNKFKLLKIFRKLKVVPRAMTRLFPTDGINLLLDASGFHYSDQFKINPIYLEKKEQYYKELKSKNTKIVFLPQAFGPFNSPEGKKMVGLINTYADHVFVRDRKSWEYLKESTIDPKKFTVSPDFTGLVSPKVSRDLLKYKNYVCIIPNKRMLDKGGLNEDQYLNFLQKTIKFITSNGVNVYLLNHEGKADYELCQEVNARLNRYITVVNGLGALEIKALISTSKLVISSRFHGVASALTSAVPCLATSWSHKYKMLYEDFQFSNGILDVEAPENNFKIIGELLDDDVNKRVREELGAAAKKVKLANEAMWNKVWAI